MRKMIIVCGPTATGKTQLALSIAEEVNGELVSADSRQIYRGMDIGTGKDLVDKKTMGGLKLSVTYNKTNFELVPYDVHGIPLWMYDVVNPDEVFTVAHYQYLARCVIDSISKRGKVPIVVGGTGLYVRSILSPFETAGITPDTELRKKLSTAPLSTIQEMVKSGNSDIWNTMNNSDRSNPRRLVRKLEIIRSKKHPKLTEEWVIEYIAIGLTAPNPVLYERIDTRVEKRMKDGLLDEIGDLERRGYDWRLPSFEALGYRQWRIWFDDRSRHSQTNKSEIIKRWKLDEHAYAKRQMTWFKKDIDIRWFDISRTDASVDAKKTAVAWYNKK